MFESVFMSVEKQYLQDVKIVAFLVLDTF